MLQTLLFARFRASNYDKIGNNYDFFGKIYDKIGNNYDFFGKVI